MKTAKLIELLRDADPTGGVECCIDNSDILFVDRVEAYYDGCLEVLERDKANIITGAKVVSRGMKVRLHPWMVEDAVTDSPDLPVDVSGMGTEMRRDWQQSITGWRKKGRKLEAGQ